MHCCLWFSPHLFLFAGGAGGPVSFFSFKPLKSSQLQLQIMLPGAVDCCHCCCCCCCCCWQCLIMAYNVYLLALTFLLLLFILLYFTRLLASIPPSSATARCTCNMLTMRHMSIWRLIACHTPAQCELHSALREIKGRWWKSINNLNLHFCRLIDVVIVQIQVSHRRLNF